MDDVELNRVFSTNLSREIALRGVKKRELAERCDMAPARISELLSGQGNPTLDTVDKIAAALQLPPAALLAPLTASIAG